MAAGARSPVRAKWRPALWMVVFGVLVAVAILPLAGLLLIVLFERLSGLTFHLRSFSGLFSLAAVSLIFALGVGYVFLRTLLTPVLELIARTVEIERGKPGAFRPIHRAGTREMATLADKFFAIARKLSDRSAYLSVFTSHVSHELKSPLTSIQGAAELLRDQGDSMTDDQRQHFLANIIDDTERLALLSTRLRELAHAEVSDTGGSSRLHAVIERVAELAGLDHQSSGPAEIVLAMSNENARIVFRQLALNARQHGATTLTVLAEADGTHALVKVGDDGAPISEGNRDKVFDPFFTTRRDSDGTGIGLCIARAMLEAHGGSIDLCTPGDRFKFALRIPAAAGPPHK